MCKLAKISLSSIRNLPNLTNKPSKDGEPEGHLLSYPIDVFVNIDDDVPVVQLLSRTNNKRFPDSKYGKVFPSYFSASCGEISIFFRAKILGKGARSIPNKLTT